MSGKPIRWREPYRARARRAREQIRRGGWLFIAAAGASIPVVGTTLLLIWWHETGEPVRPVLPVLLLCVGATIAALLALEPFLPRSIRFGPASIFLGEPRTVEWIRYAKVARCEITSSPDPELRVFGQDGTLLFAIFVDPRVDLDSLEVQLSEKGLAVQRGAV